MTPDEQVRFVEGCLREGGVTFNRVWWDARSKFPGPCVENWGGSDDADLLVGRAFVLLALACGEEPYSCAACWAAGVPEDCHAGRCATWSVA